MNTIQKTLLYPIVATAIIILVTCLNWLLTAFFSFVFDTTLNDVACSPMVLVYLVSSLGTLYMIVNCFQYIDEKL